MKTKKSSIIFFEKNEYWLIRNLFNQSGIFSGSYNFHSMNLIHHKPGLSIKIDWRKYFKTGIKEKKTSKTEAIKYCEEETNHCQGIADFKITSKHYKKEKFDSQFICYKCIRYRIHKSIASLLRDLQKYRLIERMEVSKINDFKVNALATILTGYMGQEIGKKKIEANRKFLKTINEEKMRLKRKEVNIQEFF
jgi:hypothetical protein